MSLTREALAGADPGGMLGDVLDQPSQLEDALWRVESARLPSWDVSGGLLVCGMGGSAVGADLAAGAVGARGRRRMVSHRDYGVPPFTGPDVLVLCASYSGNTEETLSGFAAAGEAGAPRVVVTTGGRLAAAARDAGVPVIGVPAGLQPRAAVGYMTVAALECAAACGAAPSLRSEIEAAAGLLAELVEEWGPDAGEASEAKRLARALQGTVPVVYGAGAQAPVAMRWKTQLNENAKAPAFCAVLPEADHNDVCGWVSARGRASFSAVFLEDADLHPRTAVRVALTAELTAAGAAVVERVPARGGTPVQRVLSQVLLGDLVSIYLAALEGVDPTPVEPIERLKERLAAAG